MTPCAASGVGAHDHDTIMSRSACRTGQQQATVPRFREKRYTVPGIVKDRRELNAPVAIAVFLTGSGAFAILSKSMITLAHMVGTSRFLFVLMVRALRTVHWVVPLAGQHA